MVATIPRGVGMSWALKDVLALMFVEIHAPPRMSVRRAALEAFAEPSADVHGDAPG